MLFVTILLPFVLFSTAEIIDSDIDCDVGKNCSRSRGTVSCIKIMKSWSYMSQIILL